jgi:hypothetical protein
VDASPRGFVILVSLKFTDLSRKDFSIPCLQAKLAERSNLLLDNIISPDDYAVHKMKATIAMKRFNQLL